MFTTIISIASITYLMVNFNRSNEYALGYAVMAFYIFWAAYFALYLLIACALKFFVKNNFFLKSFAKSVLIFVCLLLLHNYCLSPVEYKHWLQEQEQAFKQRNEQTQKDLDSLNEKLVQEPDNYQLLTERGKQLERMFKFDEAIADLERAIQLNPSYVPAYQELNYVLSIHKRNNDAMQLCKKVLKAYKQNKIQLTDKEKEYFERNSKQ